MHEFRRKMNIVAEHRSGWSMKSSLFVLVNIKQIIIIKLRSTHTHTTLDAISRFFQDPFALHFRFNQKVFSWICGKVLLFTLLVIFRNAMAVTLLSTLNRCRKLKQKHPTQKLNVAPFFFWDVGSKRCLLWLYLQLFLFWMFFHWVMSLSASQGYHIEYIAKRWWRFPMVNSLCRLSRLGWCTMDFRKNLKTAKEAWNPNEENVRTRYNFFVFDVVVFGTFVVHSHNSASVAIAKEHVLEST